MTDFKLLEKLCTQIVACNGNVSNLPCHLCTITNCNSDIWDICSSPRLFAACHVLLRLLMPRHSPCALFSLTCGVASCASLARPRQPFSLRCRSHSLRCSAFFLKNLPIFEELDESRDLRSLATPCLRDLVLLNYAGNSLEKL